MKDKQLLAIISIDNRLAENDGLNQEERYELGLCLETWFDCLICSYMDTAGGCKSCPVAVFCNFLLYYPDSPEFRRRALIARARHVREWEREQEN